MKTIAVAVLAVLALAAQTLAAPSAEVSLTRQTVAALTQGDGAAAVLAVGHVRDVVSVHVESSDFSGGVSYDRTFLDVDTEATGGVIAHAVVRFECGSTLGDACRALAKGARVLVLGKFALLRSGDGDTLIQALSVQVAP